MRSILLSLVFLSAAAAASAASLLEIRFPVTKYKLDNGLTVILHEDHSTPMVSYHTWYKVGSRDEAEGITGSAHMLEHMMFQGAKKYSGKQSQQLLEENGIDWNAFTSSDTTGFYMNLPSDKLELVMDIEFDRMSSLRIDPKNLQSELEVVKEERRLRVDNSPIGYLYENTMSTVFKTSNYRWPVIGWMQDITAYKPEVLRSFYDRFYGPNNAVLVLAGDFDSEKVKKMIDRYYGKLKVRPVGEIKYPAEQSQIEARRATVAKDVQSVTFNVAFQGVGVNHKDMYALDILASVLGSGSSSRLHRELVYEKKWAASVGSFHRSWQDMGLFGVSVALKPGEKPERAVALVREELNRVQRGRITDAELKKAKVMVMKSAVDSLTTLDRKARALAAAEIGTGSYETLFTDLDRYQAVTAADVQRCAREYLSPSKQSTVILQPQTKTAMRAGGSK